MTFLKLNTNYNSYLSNCDLLNKYGASVKDLNQLPRLDSISVELPLDTISNYGDNSLNLQYKSFILLYLFTSYTPFINFSNKKSLTKNITVTNNCTLKIKLSTSNDINYFLISFFIENWNNLSLDEFKLFDKKILKALETYKNDKLIDKFSITSKVSKSSIINFEQVSNKTGYDFSSINSPLTIRFFFSNANHHTSIKSFVKNIPLFWISG